MSNISLHNLTNDMLAIDYCIEADKVFGGIDVGSILGKIGGGSGGIGINLSFTTIEADQKKVDNIIAVRGDAIFQQGVDQFAKG